jgi:hypothetical protein
MRRRIKLTGRRELRKSAVRVALSDLGGKRLLTMTIAQPEAFKPFPTEAKVSLRLIENKKVEIVDLGTVGKLSTVRELKADHFVAPSCQLRVADPGFGTKGLLLASTDNWTLRGDDEKDNEASRGILLFLADETAPQSWKLDMRENDHPLIRVDRRIPNAALWARNDPVFVGTVLPTVVRQVFDEILRGDYSEDTPWVVDWLRWADTLLPGQVPPIGEDDKATRLEFLERLVDSFCARHDLAEGLLQAAKPEEMQ